MDAILEDMNDRMAELADEIAYTAFSGEEPTPTDLLGLGHEATGVLYDAQQDLEDLVGTEALNSLDDNTSGAWNYIDLGPFRDATLELADEQAE